MSSNDNDLSETYAAINIIKKLYQRHIGVAIFKNHYRQALDNHNSLRYCLELFEFIDNEQYSYLDSLLLQVGKVTVYFSDDFSDSNKSDNKRIHGIIDSQNCDKIFVKRSCFSKKIDTLSKLSQLCSCDDSNHSITLCEKERDLAFGSAECLISCQKLLELEDSVGRTVLQLSSMSAFMRLNSSAADAVNLLPKPDHPSQFGSLYGILNRCKTKMGSRLLERWLRQPLVNESDINQRLDIVETIKESTITRHQLSEECLKAIPDLEVIMTKMQKKNAGLSEVYRLYLFTKSLPKILNALKNLLQDQKEEIVLSFTTKFISPLLKLQSKFQLYEQLVENVIDTNQLPELLIKSSHSPELHEISEQLSDIEISASQILDNFTNKYSSIDSNNIRLEDNQQHGYILRSTKNDDCAKLSKIPNVQVFGIQKNGVHFTTNELKKLAEHRTELQLQYKNTQQNVVVEVLKTAMSYLPVVEIASSVISELDVLTAFATAAAVSPSSYYRPKILPKGSGIVDIKGSRHPCVELMDGVSYISNDYKLIKEKSNYQIITGPNMGGKSTYIRGLGSILVLAQIGSFIPCDVPDPIVTIVDSILARVGAGDAVQKGVSTFMAEMLEASVILQTLTSDSLLIIDELGRGTSTFDGYGIAYAISEYILKNSNCFTLFATHFHELTILSKEFNSVVNKHVSAAIVNNQNKINSKSLVMLYEVKDGPCNESYGVYVAESAGFPEEVIAEAKRKANELERNDDINNVETNLNYVQKFIVESKNKKICLSMKTFRDMPIESLKSNEIRESLIPLFPSYEK